MVAVAARWRVRGRVHRRPRALPCDGTTGAGRFARRGQRVVGRDLACASWREAREIVLGVALRSTERHEDGRGPCESAREGVVASADDAPRRRVDATARVAAVIAASSGGTLRLGGFWAPLHAAPRYYLVPEDMRYYAHLFPA